MYKPLPNCLTIKKSPIEGLGLYAKETIEANCFIGITHIQDKDFDNGYIRTPLGGFYNHSNEPNIIRMVSDVLPKLKFGDPVDPNVNKKQLKDGKNDRQDMFYNLEEKSDAKYMFLITVKDIKTGQELTANYNLYTYPKTGVGLQMI